MVKKGIAILYFAVGTVLVATAIFAIKPFWPALLCLCIGLGLQITAFIKGSYYGKENQKEES